MDFNHGQGRNLSRLLKSIGGKFMKKTICLLMAIAMLVCSIPFGAFAVGEDYSSWEVHMWNGVESLSSTRPFELEEVEYNGSVYGATATYYADASDTWVGMIIKKPDCPRHRHRHRR